MSEDRKAAYAKWEAEAEDEARAKAGEVPQS